MLTSPLPNSVCLVAFTGFTMPSPEDPSPCPCFHPIFWSILLPNPVVCLSQLPNLESITSVLRVTFAGLEAVAALRSKNENKLYLLASPSPQASEHLASARDKCMFNGTKGQIEKLREYRICTYQSLNASNLISTLQCFCPDGSSLGKCNSTARLAIHKEPGHHF